MGVLNMRFLPVVFLALCITQCSTPSWAGAHLKILETINQGTYRFELRLTAKSKGEKLSDLADGADIAHNIGYFDNYPGRTNLFPIGRVVIGGVEKTVCPAPPGRCYVWQKDGRLEDGDTPPQKSDFLIGGFAALVREKKALRSWQNPPDSYNVSRQRLILAFKGEQIFFIRGHGTLKEVAKKLESWGFRSATNLDGGTSMQRDTRIVTAIAGYRSSTQAKAS